MEKKVKEILHEIEELSFEERKDLLNVLVNGEAKDSKSNDLSFIKSFTNYSFKDIVIAEYINDLIYGKIGRIKNIKRITNILGLGDIPKIVMVILCDDWVNVSKNLKNNERYNVKRKLINTIRSASENICKSVAETLVGTDKIVLLLDCSSIQEEESDKYSNEIAIYIKEYIKKYTSYTVSISISRYCNDYRKLCDAYEEAFQTLNFSFVNGKDTVLKYRDLTNLDYKNYNKAEFYFEEDMIKSLNTLSEALCKEKFDEICNVLICTYYMPEIIKSFVIRIVFALARYFSDLGIDYNLIFNYLTGVIAEIIRSVSIDSIKQVCNEFFEFIILQIKIKKEDYNAYTMENVRNYIDNYYNTDIYLKDIADMCGWSQYYCSRMFKVYFRNSFKKYLIDVRLEKAKELLILSNLSIEEICVKSGFNDIGYFSKSFKKKFKLPPSKIRK